MALVAGVKNILVRIWAWLEKFVAEEVAYQGKLAAEKLAAEQLSQAKEQAAKSAKSVAKGRVLDAAGGLKDKVASRVKQRSKSQIPGKAKE